MDEITKIFLAPVISEIIRPIILNVNKIVIEAIKSSTTNKEPFDIYIELRKSTFLRELEANAPDIKIAANIDEVIRRTFDVAQMIPRTREEKLKYLARLLQYSISEEEFVLADEFDDYLKILDELSVREMQILCIFNDYNEKFVKLEEQNDLQHSNMFWNEFIIKIKDKLHLNDDQTSAILQRICRTGCIEAITGIYWNYKGGQYKITSLFKELVKIAKIKSTDFA